MTNYPLSIAERRELESRDDINAHAHASKFYDLMASEIDAAFASMHREYERVSFGEFNADGPCSVPAPTPPPDPLDVEIDNKPLRDLLEDDEIDRREESEIHFRSFHTPAQRAAVSAHWSAELRRKVAASAERDRCAVVVDLQEVE